MNKLHTVLRYAEACHNSVTAETLCYIPAGIYHTSLQKYSLGPWDLLVEGWLRMDYKEFSYRLQVMHAGCY